MPLKCIYSALEFNAPHSTTQQIPLRTNNGNIMRQTFTTHCRFKREHERNEADAPWASIPQRYSNGHTLSVVHNSRDALRLLLISYSIVDVTQTTKTLVLHITAHVLRSSNSLRRNTRGTPAPPDMAQRAPLAQMAQLASAPGASPGLLRRRYSMPETIMRK